MRSVEISETYTPGKNLGKTRTVTVDRIPADEVTFDGITDTHVTLAVFGRTQRLVRRALRSNDLPHQHITYTPSDRCGAGARSGVETPARRKKPVQTSSSSGGEIR